MKNKRTMTYTPFNPDGTENIWNGDYEVFTFGEIKDCEFTDKRHIGTISNVLKTIAIDANFKTDDINRELRLFALKRGFEYIEYGQM